MIDLIVILSALVGFAWFGLTEPKRMEKRHKQRLRDIRTHLNVMHVLEHPDSLLSRELAKTPEIKKELDRLRNS